MKNLKRIILLAAAAACAPFFITDVCETAIAMEGHKVIAPPGGYLGDAETIRSEGGVGNYLFRYVKEPKSEVAEVEDEFSYSSQSSALRTDEMDKKPAKMEKVEHKLFFKNSSAALTGNELRKVDSLAEELKNNPDKTASIEGYSDAKGSEKYNVMLSERRAEAVVKQLKDKGVSTSQLHWEGKGSENPIGNNQTSNGRMKNRRVEIFVE